MFKNILIIAHTNIGDFCYDLVVVNPLRRQFPNAKIYVLTSSRAKDIADGYKGLDGVITFDKHAKDKGLLGRLGIMVALIKDRFDLVVVLKQTMMYRFLNIPNKWSLAKYLGRFQPEAGMHVADVFLDFLRFHNINIQKAKFDFAFNEEENSFCDAFLIEEGIDDKDKVVGIHPFSGWSLKDWPIAKWNELAKILKSKYSIKVINLSKRNDFFSQRVLENISDEIVSADETTLKQAMALIKRCSLFIGGDSSLVHLASCMGVETIGLYGPTAKIYPYFHYHNIITSQKRYHCMPCSPGFSRCREEKVQTSPCMESISLEDVLELVERKLDL
ncbi:MAG: glycosyltransferase family 9 protein [Candidatus Kaelpia imicola]|nr:glycosyltransferase family 9 protein [Candidatus Kaelpia imicola]